MKNEPMDFDELMREEEANAYERTKAEIAAEQAAWEALPQAERDRINSERTARLDAFFDAVVVAEAEESDDDEDNDEEE